MTATELGDLVEWAILAGYGLACTALGYGLAVILGRLHRRDSVDRLIRIADRQDRAIARLARSIAHAEARLAATRTGKD